MATKPEAGATIIVERVKTQIITVALIGLNPLIMNRMHGETRHQLIFPAPRKTPAQRQIELKHNPPEEFRKSVYSLDDGDTLLAMPTIAVKSAMMTAALDLPGTAKAQIGRLVWVHGQWTPVYGVPRVFLEPTRLAGIGRAYDLHARAILPEWATMISITFPTPMLNATSIVNLLAAGGLTAGIGDFRAEKGKGSYGQFSVTDADDPEFLRIKGAYGRKVQQSAIDSPMGYDQDTQDLLDWFQSELVRRGKA